MRTILRSSKSFSTVSLLNVPTMAWFALWSSSVSFSTCSIFFAFVTAMFESLFLLRFVAPADFSGQQNALAARSSFHGRRVNRDTGPHGRTEVATLDVLALGNRRLRLDHTGNHRRRILHQLFSRKRNLADGHMHQRCLVGTELHFAGLGLFHR